MAGQPLKQEVRNTLSRLAKEEIGEEATALDYVCSHIEDGGRIKELKERISGILNVEFSPEFFTRTIRTLEPDAKRRIDQAKKDSTGALVERARDIIADAPTGDKIKFERAKEEAKINLWMAERLDKQTWGQQQPQAANLTLNVGSMHLDAFRAMTHNTSQSLQIAPQAPQQALPAPQPQPPEAE